MALSLSSGRPGSARPDSQLSADTFAAAVAALQPAVVNAARRQVRNEEDAEDLASVTVLDALQAGATYDFTRGAAGLLRWLLGILSIRIANYYRAQGREERRRDPRQWDDWVDDADARWARVASDSCRAETVDRELQHEARLRYRYAALTREEEDAMRLRLAGATVRAIGETLSISKSAAANLVQRAVRKMRSEAVTACIGSELDHWQRKPGAVFGIAQDVSIYHRPVTLGTQLLNEKLRKLSRPGYDPTRRAPMPAAGETA